MTKGPSGGPGNVTGVVVEVVVGAVVAAGAITVVVGAVLALPLEHPQATTTSADPATRALRVDTRRNATARRL